MKQIKVLGSGCAKCTKTIELIKAVANELDISVNVTKETSPEVIMKYEIMTTPAVVIDDILIHSGSIPDKQKIVTWLN